MTKEADLTGLSEKKALWQFMEDNKMSGREVLALINEGSLVAISYRTLQSWLSDPEKAITSKAPPEGLADKLKVKLNSQQANRSDSRTKGRAAAGRK